MGTDVQVARDNSLISRSMRGGRSSAARREKTASFRIACCARRPTLGLQDDAEGHSFFARFASTPCAAHAPGPYVSPRPPVCGFFTREKLGCSTQAIGIGPKRLDTQGTPATGAWARTARRQGLQTLDSSHHSPLHTAAGRLARRPDETAGIGYGNTHT
jgi:hypothetical protein